MTTPSMTKTLSLAATVVMGIACNEATSPAPPVTVSKAARLAFTAQPSNATAGVAISPAVTVTIQDGSGSPMTSATDLVTVALGTNPGGGTLSGTTAVNAVNGVATFSNLLIRKASTGYILTASAGMLTAATSASFDISPAAPAKVVFVVQPSTTDVAQPITPAVQVAIQDAFANTVTSATNAVTLALATNPGSGTLAGTKTVNALGGIVTFSGLSIDKEGSGYTLAATSITLTGATSATFDITFPLTFASVSAGLFHACGVTTEGAAYCWGSNSNGQLGTGTTTAPQQCYGNPCSRMPVAVAGGLKFAEVTTGADHTCGVTTSGAAYCWGVNKYGELGDGTTTDRPSPVLVLGGLTFAAVSAGSFHTCAVTTAGAAYCWGVNYGELGDGTTDTTTRTKPVAVVGGLTFAAVTAGDTHTCGVTTAGVAYCWGYNDNGQLGDGFVDTIAHPMPEPVMGGLAFGTVSTGEGGNHVCGVTAARAAYCWGYNGTGALGDGTTTTPRASPVAVLGGLTFAAVSAGSFHTCAVTTGGAAYCWGASFAAGALGDGTTTQRTSPVAVLGGLSFGTVSAGDAYTCGVTTAGRAYCWGSNIYGQLGDGTTTNRLTPVRVE